MPTSYKWGKAISKSFIRTVKFSSEKLSLLDIGCGKGNYYDLLFDVFDTLEAVEVYEPYIDQFKLKEKYDVVYCCNITDFNFPKKYNLIIAGDVLEHLPTEIAIKELDRWLQYCEMILVSVPFKLPQGMVHGNEHERHHQDDLTPEIMAERYPQLKLLVIQEKDGIPKYGYYINKDVQIKTLEDDWKW